MGSIVKKIMNKNDEKEKYSFISVEDLNKLQVRALVLADELKNIDILSNPDEYKVRLKEYVNIVEDLRKYKKYAKSWWGAIRYFW